MFSAEASASLAGPDWLRQRRAGGYEAFASTPLPAESEEVWRYSPIDELSLDDFVPSAPNALKIDDPVVENRGLTKWNTWSGFHLPAGWVVTA